MRIDLPTTEQIPALWALWQEAFGDDEPFLSAFERAAFSLERCRCVSIDGEVAAALYWFDCLCDGVPMAYLYAIATAKAHRGRGLCAALMADTHAHLAARGYAAALLVPSEPSLFGFYARMGYVAFGSIREFFCEVGERAVTCRTLSKAAYAEARRRLLPPGGVIQEKENLDFLETQAELFGGENFVLAARREGDTLYGAELLGDSARAPEILRALGCTRGQFRTLGEGRSFAMYRPLRKDAPIPSYFGLAFD